MKLKNLKDLEKVMDLCRAKGIREITIDGVHFKVDDVPVKGTDESPMLIDPALNYTDEQIANWSSDGA